MQNYEIALIINPDLSKDIDKFFTSFEKLLTENSFTISKLEDVGRRKLAYSIDDHNKGHYLFYYVEGSSEKVSEIENKIKFNDMIIRHLFVKINNVPDFVSDLKEDNRDEVDKTKKAEKSKKENNDNESDKPESEPKKQESKPKETSKEVDEVVDTKQENEETTTDKEKKESVDE
tara:strand:+ start:5043 stop:5567 length:525 start_codon:yes stop_codon:yes gene_type:complete